ncbi:MAG: hypothetical protein MZU91_06035 [Desulfosudis oleivorans]|nr:hypothetical protein [Desulfosudis oleivorans]
MLPGKAVKTSFSASVPPVDAPIAIILLVVLIKALVLAAGWAIVEVKGLILEILTLAAAFLFFQ